MTSHRFFVPVDAIEGGAATLPDAAASQVRRVLRLRPGDAVSVFDGSGAEWPATLTRVDRRAVTATLGERAWPAAEPSLRVSLLLGLTRPERFELALEKCTELGAHRFTPCITDRVQGRDASAPSAARLARWRRIITEAAEQSGRVRVPVLDPPGGLAAAVHDAAQRGPVVMLWEEETAPLRDVLQQVLDGSTPEDLALVIGPVGGLGREEVQAAVSQGAVTAGMGSRVLRAETAAIAGLTAVLYHARELGG